MLLEFSLGKLVCEVDQWNCRPQSWGRGIFLSLDLTQLTRVHRANLLRIKAGLSSYNVYVGQSIDYSMMGLEKSMVEGSISLDRL